MTQKPMSLPKKRMTSDDRRQSLIDATIRVVSRLNYDRATTALIAKEAKVNEALIYSHYKSKKDLQMDALDYMVTSRLQFYRANPVFLPENRCQSVVRSLNAQYLQMIQSPEIQVFSCLLKAMVAIDPEIQKKSIACSMAFQQFIRENLMEDRVRGFFDDRFDPDIIAWEILGKIILVATLAVTGSLDKFGMDAVRTSIRYLEDIYLKKKP
ncbi:MAG: TetR/AcrR family transcriptional regulator [Desulfobacteraceae bacterium]|nr:MAG: TetR/AcrR family transcriptional regulator [Desulfobacteraceae bacterium]